MQGLKSEAVAWSTDVKKVVALCHDLVPLSKGNLAGQLDERMAFADVEAAFLVRLAISHHHVSYASLFVHLSHCLCTRLVVCALI